MSICDNFTTDFDVIFNAQKTKCIFFDSAVSKPSSPLHTFYVGNNVMGYVDCWPHLGHILSNTVKCDNDDIRRCYLSLVKQINEKLRYFRNLDVSTRLKLLYSFCNSLYGAELWDLSRCDFGCITVAWRKALKRVWSLPWRTHSNILYTLSNKWPIEEEIYRRLLLFGIRCINSESTVVRYVSRFGIKYGLMHSILGRNILFEVSDMVLKYWIIFVWGSSLFVVAHFKSCILI